MNGIHNNEIKQLRQDKTNLEQFNSDLQNNIQDMDSELKGCHVKIDELTNTNTELNTSNKTLQDKLNKLYTIPNWNP